MIKTLDALKQFSAAALLLLSLNTSAQIPDINYGRNGILNDTVYGEGENFGLTSTVVLPNGQVVWCGNTELDVYDDECYFVSATPQGLPGNSFGKNGIMYQKASWFGRMAAQNNNKFVVTTRVADNSSDYNYMYTSRYLNNGKLDSTFGKHGFVVTYDSVNFYRSNSPGCIVTDKNNFIYIGGAFNKDDYSDEPYHSLTRFTPNGVQDTTYASHILVPGNWVLRSIRFCNDDKLLVAYSYTDSKALTTTFAFLKVLADGSAIDSSFGTNGIALSKQIVSNEVIFLDMQILKDDSFISLLEINKTLVLNKYKPNAVADSSFNNNGILNTNIVSNPYQYNNPYFYNIAIDSSGIILLPMENFKIKAYTPNGVTDSSFGENGIITTQVVDNPNKYFYSGFNNIYVVGNSFYALGSYSNINGSYFTSAKYLNETVLPLSINNFVVTKKSLTTSSVQWQVINETNIKNYIVERSGDNLSFNSIQTVYPKNNGVNNAAYTVLDKSPLAGKNYYRIKSISEDGNIVYSKIQFVDFAKNDLNVYPNPANNIIYISGLYNNASLNIINSKGIIVKTIMVSAANNSINIEDLGKGLYHLYNPETKQSASFIKQ